MEFTNNIQFINREMFINDLEREMIINDRERELNAAIINSYILAVPEREQPVAEEPASEEPAPEVTREVDQCVYQLCSKQDRVYTKQENLDEDTEIWKMALWDGHGSTKGPIDPKTWRPTKVNFMLDCLDEMIANGEIDGILQKDIWHNRYNWLQELLDNIDKILSEKVIQNIYMCKKDEYKDFDISI